MKSVYDVASFAEKLGYSYNQVINMMEKSGVVPFYEQKTLTIYTGVGKDYGWSEKLSDIFDAYVKENGAQDLTD